MNLSKVSINLNFQRILLILMFVFLETNKKSALERGTHYFIAQSFDIISAKEAITSFVGLPF